MPAVAVVFGLLCAASWGSSSIFGARASRAHGAVATAFWVQVVGIAFIVPLAIGAGVPDAPRDDWLLAAIAGSATSAARPAGRSPSGSARSAS